MKLYQLRATGMCDLTENPMGAYSYQVFLTEAEAIKHRNYFLEKLLTAEGLRVSLIDNISIKVIELECKALDNGNS